MIFVFSSYTKFLVIILEFNFWYALYTFARVLLLPCLWAFINGFFWIFVNKQKIVEPERINYLLSAGSLVTE